MLYIYVSNWGDTKDTANMLIQLVCVKQLTQSGNSGNDFIYFKCVYEDKTQKLK